MIIQLFDRCSMLSQFLNKTSSYSSVAARTRFQRLLLDLVCGCSASDGLSTVEPFRRGGSLTLAEDSSEKYIVESVCRCFMVYRGDFTKFMRYDRRPKG